MGANVQETFQYYPVANANVTCFVGPGSCGGFACSAAGGTVILCDANSAANANQVTDALWQVFTPTAGLYYPAPAKVRYGLTVICTTGNLTVYGNKG